MRVVMARAKYTRTGKRDPVPKEQRSFGKRHYVIFSKAISTLPPDQRTLVGVFTCAVFMHDNPAFSSDIYLQECGVKTK